MIFGMLILRKFDVKILHICPPHLSDVATLPWDIQKSHYEKDWKHVLMQKVVTLNTCCDIACLTFQLPHVTTGVFSHRGQPTTGSLHSLQHPDRWISVRRHRAVFLSC